MSRLTIFSAEIKKIGHIELDFSDVDLQHFPKFKKPNTGEEFVKVDYEVQLRFDGLRMTFKLLVPRSGKFHGWVETGPQLDEHLGENPYEVATYIESAATAFDVSGYRIRSQPEQGQPHQPTVVAYDMSPRSDVDPDPSSHLGYQENGHKRHRPTDDSIRSRQGSQDHLQILRGSFSRDNSDSEWQPGKYCQSSYGRKKSRLRRTACSPTYTIADSQASSPTISPQSPQDDLQISDDSPSLETSKMQWTSINGQRPNKFPDRRKTYSRKE